MTASLAALVPAAMWALHQPLAAAALLVAFLATVGVGHRYAETLKRFRRGRRFAEAVAARLRPPVHGPSSDAGGRVDPAGDRSME